MDSESMFENLNGLQKIQFFSASSPEEMHKFITSIRHPMKIISMYSGGPNHYCWFISDAKIIKTIKKGK